MSLSSTPLGSKTSPSSFLPDERMYCSHIHIHIYIYQPLRIQPSSRFPKVFNSSWCLWCNVLLLEYTRDGSKFQETNCRRDSKRRENNRSVRSSSVMVDQGRVELDKSWTRGDWINGCKLGVGGGGRRRETQRRITALKEVVAAWVWHS